MKELKIYLDKIVDEVEKPIAPNCFLGAYYHKVFSARDKWEGIEGTIILPEANINRFNEEGDNLDVSSIYMGGLAKYESDVGLALMKVYLKDGSLSPKALSFRPFWRYITDQENDASGYDVENGRYYSSLNLTPNASTSNCYAQYIPSFSEYYYLPGDKVKIVISYPKEDFMMLTVELIEKSNLEYSVNLRKENNWKDPETFKSPLFSSPIGDYSKREFKRVNAIDQRSNEGKNIIPTKTTVLNAKWESVYLHRTIDGVKYLVPFNSERSATMNCPEENMFNVSKIDNKTGATVVNIIPNNIK